VKWLGDYADYFLRDNPFPATAVIDPYSTDARVNGSIFNEDVFEDKIEELRRKTEQKINLVYICGGVYDRGLGKSALMIHHMRFLERVEGVTCAYIRCEEKDKPVDLARKAIIEWHEAGYLWNAFSAAFIDYCRAAGDVMLPIDAVEMLLSNFRTPPSTLPLKLYLHVRGPDEVSYKLGRWLRRRVGADAQISTLLDSYLSKPVRLFESISSRKVDCMALFRSCLRLMDAYGYRRHYLFLDQFEDLVMGVSKSRLGRFALGIKNLVSASSSATMFVTLHPNSEQYLKDPKARDLTGVAPIDAAHRVNLLTLDADADKAVRLAIEYLDYFRDGSPPYASYPYEYELLSFMWYVNKGVIRNYLQQLHNSLEYGVIDGCPELTFEYAKTHQQEILGREVYDKLITEYERWRAKSMSKTTGRA